MAVEENPYKFRPPVLEPCFRRSKADAGQAPANLNLQVVFTTLAATAAAAKAASGLAHDLGARITILAAQVVPYPLPLEDPPVPAAFTERTLRQLMREQQIETAIQVFLCRDREETIREKLPPGSIVVLGMRRGWWPTRDRIFAWSLSRMGHRTILIDPTRAPSRGASCGEILSIR